MKRTIPSVPQLYRNVRRWTEIVSVLSKYGLADWLSQFNIDFLTNLLSASEGHSQSNLTQADNRPQLFGLQNNLNQTKSGLATKSSFLYLQSRNR